MVSVYGKSHLGGSFLRLQMCTEGNELLEEVGKMGTSGNRNALKDFTDDALTISAGSLFDDATARVVKANWQRRVQHRYNHVKNGCVKIIYMYKQNLAKYNIKMYICRKVQ